jgi:hypothetical protein
MSLTKNDLLQIKKIVSIELTDGLKPIKNDVKKIRADINIIVDHFDRDYLEMRARIDRIERFLKIPQFTP